MAEHFCLKSAGMRTRQFNTLYLQHCYRTTVATDSILGCMRAFDCVVFKFRIVALHFASVLIFQFLKIREPLSLSHSSWMPSDGSVHYVQKLPIDAAAIAARMTIAMNWYSYVCLMFPSYIAAGY